MANTAHTALTRRERQIMDILYRRGRATAAEVLEDLPGDTHYSTVRTQLRVLEEKGHVSHEDEGLRYEKAVAALLGGEASRLSEEEMNRIADLIARTRKDGPR